MADFPDAPQPKSEYAVSRLWRTVFSVAGFLFGLGLIAWIGVKGVDANSLHQSALSWAFMLVGGVLGGVGFGAVLPYLPTKK